MATTKKNKKIQKKASSEQEYIANTKRYLISTKQQILFVLTGGTIDSYFDPKKDSIESAKSSTISDYINKMNIQIKPEFEKVCMKDSRDLTQKDREKILATIQNSAHKKIVITHGTYTMAETGKYLKDNLADNERTVVITGSMVPLEGFYQSDAPFNLGYAIASAQNLAPGVYICFNSKVLDPTVIQDVGKF